MLLNYGHTIGHALETATRYERYLHGEAVAVGMAGAAAIACQTGRFDPTAVARQAALLDRFGLPQSCPGLNAEDLWAPMRRDKKAVSARLRWVLPTAIGSAEVVDDVPEELVQSILQDLVRN